MGLMDIINGMSNGPHAQPSSAPASSGTSPITMGLLALLAYKAFSSGGSLGGMFGQGSVAVPGGATSADNYRGSPSGRGSETGGLMDWVKGSLGGGAAGGSTGSVVSGGLGELVKRFQKNGFGDVANSWIDTGPNKPIAPDQIEKAAGTEELDVLAKEMGMPREQLLAKLSSELPNTVDRLTPAGRLPDTA
jgi:uncharacterized protein YidB (DUF937 family)